MTWIPLEDVCVGGGGFSMFQIYFLQITQHFLMLSDDVIQK